MGVRVCGLVQGVGFRPAVWHLATTLGLTGDVRNDGAGVWIRLWGDEAACAAFCERLRAESPPLARIETLTHQALARGERPEEPGFLILASQAGLVRTGVVPDAATCPACQAEIFNPNGRRYRYPFTNCTHCGPRLSIVRGIPYDRIHTSMAAFALCPACAKEYKNPADRRFHAQPIACPRCGPQVWLVDRSGLVVTPGDRDAITLASDWLAQGQILALKGIGGFHLACDAGHAETVAELRRRKRRFEKPFALMARDLAVVRCYVQVTAYDAAALQGRAAPILLLDRLDPPNGPA
ncbi:MAG: acylphosphatase, partial [Pseudomonadota bacterium]